MRVKRETLLAWHCLLFMFCGIQIFLHYKLIHTSFSQASQASGASVAPSGKSQEYITKDKQTLWLKDKHFQVQKVTPSKASRQMPTL